MLLLTKNDIQQLFTMHDAIDAARDALSAYSRGKSIVPLRITIPVANQQAASLFMPAYVDDVNALGIKVVSVFPHNAALNKPVIPAQMILMDAQTGEVCSIMDGTYLTELRTGAVQGLATQLLSRPDAKIGLLIGTGGQAPAQLEAMLSVRKLDQVYVASQRFENAQKFAMHMAKELEKFGTQIVPIADANEAVKLADIITTATPSKTPVFDGSLVKPGTHVNGIGAYTPDMQELPETIVSKANKIFFDTSEGVLAEAGDILIPLKNGSIDRTHFSGELGHLILKQVEGREKAEEITLFKTVGSAVLDVVTAQKIYQKALKQKIGQKIDL